MSQNLQQKPSLSSTASKNEFKIPALNLKQEYNKVKQNQMISYPNSSRSNRTQKSTNRYLNQNSSRHKYNKSSSQMSIAMQKQETQMYFARGSHIQQQMNNTNSLDNDQSTFYIQQLHDKEKQIEKLNSQLRTSNARFNNKELDSVFNIDIENGQQDQIRHLKQVLVEIIYKEKQYYNQLKQRCSDLANFMQVFQGDDIINFDNQRDYTKFREQVDVLLQSLQEAAKTEIDLGAKVRECERLNIDVSIQKNKGKNLQEKNVELQKIIDILQNQNKSLTEENNSLQRLLNIEKKTAETNQRKVSQLEKRIEFILENDINTQLNPNDKLRNSLNELLRENESLKRDLTHKNQEIERQQGTIKKLNSFIQRLNKKIDGFKKAPGGGSSEQQNNQVIKSQADETSKFYKKDDIDLLSNYIIPDNLDYRIISLKSEYMNVLSDVVEIGPLGFSNHVIKQKDQTDQKEMICLVTNQFLSYKELAEKLNYMVRNVQSIYDLTDIRDIIYSINGKFNTVFNANKMNLWIVDRQTGLLFTYNDIGIKKCVMNKGIIGEVFYYKQALNIKNAKAKALLYNISEYSYKEEPDYVETTLLLPIFVHKGNIKAVIEISNSQNDLFSFDEEYLGIVLAKYVGMCLQHFIERQVMQIEIKYKNLMFNAFEELSLCQERFEYTKLIQNWMKVLFGINQSIFYFIEDNKLTQYDQFNNKTQYSLDHGLVGLVAQQQKGLIINDIKYSSVYNKLVDIKTIMPLYAVPLIEKVDLEPQTLAVMEICLKSQFKSKFERDQLIDPEEGLLGVEEPVANVIQNFLKLVGLSLRHNQFKSKEEIISKLDNTNSK